MIFEELQIWKENHLRNLKCSCALSKLKNIAIVSYLDTILLNLPYGVFLHQVQMSSSISILFFLVLSEAGLI